MNFCSQNRYKFKTQPWSHQLMALDFLYQRDVAALYTDMGTGKSKVMIDLIVNRGFKRVLIVCTKKGCDNWVKQFKLHDTREEREVLNFASFSPKRKSTLLNSLVSKGRDFPNKNSSCIILINYESIWREPMAKAFLSKRLGLDCVICDESHRIKTPSSKCSKYLRDLGKKVPHRYLVTGTPLAENPSDIFAQYRFLDPEIFGTSLSAFRERYENLDVDRTTKVRYRVLNEKEPYINLDELEEKMFSCAFRIKSSIKLSRRLNIVYEFDLSPKENLAYSALENEGVIACQEGELSVDNILSMSLRKQQVASGYVPILVEPDEDSEEEPYTTIKHIGTSRLDAFVELLESLPKKEPVVVFAKFREDLEGIRAWCNCNGRGYSEVSGKYNEEEPWQRGETSVLGVQYNSGSESIDLTRAHYCFYYSHTHSLALYSQSKKRIHRPGQTRKCIYYYLVCKRDKGKSIDRTIIEALQKKQSIVDAIVKDHR